MNSRERVSAAISRLPADRVPRGEIYIGGSVVRSLLGCEGSGFEERLEFSSRLGLDIACLQEEFPAADSRLPRAEEVSWPDLGRWARETGLFTFVMIDGAFGWGTRLLGFERFFSMLAGKPRDLIDLIGAVESLNLDLAGRASAEGAAGVIIADDIAYGRGLMVNPLTLRQCYFPSLTRQVESIKSREMAVFFHSDGNLGEVLDDVAGAGFDGLQCIEPAAGMDIGNVKQKFGGRLCLWGNLDPRWLLPPLHIQGLREELAGIVSSAAPGGGFVFGSCCGLFDGIDTENLLAVYEILDQLEA